MFKRIQFPLIAIVCGFLALGLSLVAVGNVHAQTPALVDAGLDAPADPAVKPMATTTSTTVTTTTQPADSLHNVVEDPLAAINDVRQAKKQGWAMAILTSFILLTAGFARASTKWPTFPVLSTINKHKTVIIVIGCLGAACVAAYNSIALGGSWFAALGVGAIAAVTFVNAQPSEAK